MDSRVTVLGPNRVGVALSLAISAICVTAATVAIALGAVHGKEGASFLNVMTMFTLGGGFGAYFFTRIAKRSARNTGELTVDDEWLYVAGAPLVRRAAVVRAYVIPGPSGATVRLERRMRTPIDLAVADIAAGRALLKTIGLDAAQTASEFSILSITREAYRKRFFVSMGSFFPLIGAMVGAGFARKAYGLPNVAIAALMLIGFGLYFAMLLQIFKRTRVIVGADGIDLQWFWQRKFIPMKDIERAEVVETDARTNNFAILVRLHMRNGPPVDLISDFGRVSVFGSADGFNRFIRLRAETLAERINEVVEQRPPIAAWNTTALLREGRPIAEWVESLRTLRDRVQTFREGSALEQLWGILEDVNAAPEERAAAAVALSQSLDDEGRERVRVAARATGAPKLRIALEAAAHHDDEKLIDALDEVTQARQG